MSDQASPSPRTTRRWTWAVLIGAATAAVAALALPGSATTAAEENKNA